MKLFDFNQSPILNLVARLRNASQVSPEEQQAREAEDTASKVRQRKLEAVKQRKAELREAEREERKLQRMEKLRNTSTVRFLSSTRRVASKSRHASARRKRRKKETRPSIALVSGSTRWRSTSTTA